MSSHSLRLSLLALALPATLVLSACTAEEPPPPAAGPAGETGETAGDPQPSSNPVVDQAAVLEVEDQTSEGPTVLAKAAATQGGFVVVLGDDGRNVLGASNVEPGTEPVDVQISLAEEIVEQVDLTARLYADTNGDGLYGAGDEPISNGENDDDDDPATFAGERESFTFKGKPVVNS